MAGALRLTREQLAIITGGDPRAIKALEDFFATLTNLGSHHATHEPGGSDPLTVNAAAAVGSLRSLGVGAAQACAGNDARLSDDRDPTAHAVDHEAGGADELDVAALGGFTGGATDFLREDGTWAPGGGWQKVANPSTGWIASKTSGWTADSFAGGLTVDFSALDPNWMPGARAVLLWLSETSQNSPVYSRPGGDGNISNTPDATQEYSSLLISKNSIYVTEMQAIVSLNTSGVADFTVSHVNSDLYISFPRAYLL